MQLKENLQTHLHHIVRERDPYFAASGHFYVQQYIQQQFSRWGTVEFFEFKVGGQTHQNIILKIPAKSPKNNHKPFILIGAHYDTVPGSPGADDNGTGIAVLLELARILTQQPANLPVQLVAFDLEEFGLWGSYHYATFLKQENQAIRLMFSLEMLGYCDPNPGSQSYPIKTLEYLYPNSGNFIGLIGNWQTIPDMVYLSQKIKKAGIPCQWLPVIKKGVILPDTRRSDHAPFWDCGYRAVMVTDTANLRNPHYHQPSDKIETLSLEFMAGICEGLAQGIQNF